MRVVILCEYPSLNGGERSLLAVLDTLSRRYDVHVAAPDEGPLARALAERPNVSHLPFDLRSGTGRAGNQRQRRERIAGLLQRLRPDLVHANSLSMARLSGPVAQATGVPSLGHLRDMMRLSRQTINDLHCHTRLIAVSHAVVDWYSSQGLDDSQVEVIYNGVDLTRFRPRRAQGSLAGELGLSTDARLILCIGQLGMRKGQDIVLEAAANIVRRLPYLHVLFVGERYSSKGEALQYERALRALAAAPPLVGHVHFLGVCDDVWRLMNEATLLVHGARQEPLGRVLLEAAASGLPVIATDVGGTREIFSSRASALLIPPDDPATMAEAIEQLVGDPSLCRAMATAARREAEQRFDARDVAERLAQLYAQTARS